MFLLSEVAIQTEEFLAGLNLLACYDFLEQSCEYILKKLSIMQKHSECPEECREVVGSLMFAAARFSDLPELRDLRDALQERYDSSLEHFVNRKFFERLAMKPPTIDLKIQLLEDIASELSIKWDSRGFQQRMMANPSAPAHNQVKKQEAIHDCGTAYNLCIDNETVINSIKRDQSLKEKSELKIDQRKAKSGGENYLMRKDELGQRSLGGVEPAGNGGKLHMASEENPSKRDNYNMTPRGRREKGELSRDKLRAKSGRENYPKRKDELDDLSFGRSESTTNNGKSCMGREHSTHRRGNYDVTPVGGLEDGEFSSDGLRTKNGGLQVKNGRDNYDHLLFGRGDCDSTVYSCKPHSFSEKSTAWGETCDISPHHRSELTSRLNGKEDTVQRRDGHGSSRGKRPDLIDKQNTPRIETYSINPHHRGEQADDRNELTRINGKEDTIHRRNRHGSSSRGERLEVSDDIYGAQNNRVYGFTKSFEYDSIADDNHEKLPTTRDGKHVFSAGYRDCKEPNAAKPPKIIAEEDTDKLKINSSYALPPPYVKSKDKLVPPPYMKTVKAKKVSSNHGGISADPTAHKMDDLEGRSARIRPEEDHSTYEDLGAGHARLRSNGHEKDVAYWNGIPLPKPRSMRRKHSKSSSSRDDLGDSEDSEVVKRSSTSRRRDHSNKGLQILFNEEHKQRDDEERKIDKLLLHYSRKPLTYDQEMLRRKQKLHAREAPRNGFNEEEASGLPARSVSLPREQLTSKEQVKVYARANSFQPDKPAGHVHPKLPDYDDLAARFAALKGR